MSERLFLFGSGGHSKVVIDITKSQGITVEGLFDDDQSLWGSNFYRLKVLGGKSELKSLSQNSAFHVSIGSNSSRKMVAEYLFKCGFKFKSLVHYSSIVSSSVKLGSGCSIMAGAVINADSHIGNHCIINTNSNIDHDCTIGDFVHIAPGVTVCGGVEIGSGTLVGAGVAIIPGISIGKNCIVGAGSVVVRDMPDDCKAVGNPAREID